MAKDVHFQVAVDSYGLLEHIDSDETLAMIRFIIVNHSVDDDKGKKEIDNCPIRNKELAIRLYSVFKDADALDRVRINDFDVRFIRNEDSKRLISCANELYNCPAFRENT